MSCEKCMEQNRFMEKLIVKLHKLDAELQKRNKVPDSVIKQYIDKIHENFSTFWDRHIRSSLPNRPLNDVLALSLNEEIRKYNNRAGHGFIQTPEPIVIWGGVFYGLYQKEIVEKLDISEMVVCQLPGNRTRPSFSISFKYS